ncbi:hypothetical protein FH972_024562 [Carpinus fangiana]|uniref:Zinc finger CHCC-type domain-containing protein n=1 Tax=Carpinus fangiana TaxID=176857 RepID=A0A5N6KYC7_9ROSI|nr:hypothetical protein FH972_024562 [Carpinus fangiana]
MLAAPRTRLVALAARACRGQRRWTSEDAAVASNSNKKPAPHNVSATNATPTSSTGTTGAALQEFPEDAEKRRTLQAPNRAGVWAQSQRPREVAMAGPRFEQTIMEDQPRPLAAIELIHKQPVRWQHKRQVSCDGGGGPLGHPRIFINLDKPQVCWCTYCGTPYANEHHREYLESLPSTPYPLEATGDAAETPVSQSNTGKPFEVR